MSRKGNRGKNRKRKFPKNGHRKNGHRPPISVEPKKVRVENRECEQLKSGERPTRYWDLILTCLMSIPPDGLSDTEMGARLDLLEFLQGTPEIRTSDSFEVRYRDLLVIIRAVNHTKWKNLNREIVNFGIYIRGLDLMESVPVDQPPR